MPRPFRELPEFEFWRVLHEIAEGHEGRLEDAVLGALRDFIREIESGPGRRALERALELRDVDAVIEALPFDDLAAELRALIEDLRPILDDAAAATLSELEARLRGASAAEASRAARAAVPFGFLQQNPEAIAYLERHGAEFVQQVTSATRMALRQITLAGQRDFLPISEQTNRIIQVLGLTRRQAATVENYRRELEALLAGETTAAALRERFTLSRDFGLKTLSEARIEPLVRRYRDRWVRLRAETIAGHEAGLATSSAQRLAWSQAIQNGLLDPNGWVREWVAIVPDPDGRTCPLCRALDGKTASLGDELGGWGLYYAEGTEDGIIGPKRHIRCRCTERLIPVGLEGLPPIVALPDDLDAEHAMEFGSGVTGAYRDSLAAAWEGIPRDVRRAVIDYGLDIQIPKRVADVQPLVASMQPPGFPPGFTGASAPGLYVPAERMLVIPEEILNPYTGRWQPPHNAAGTLRHEVGHVIDFALSDVSISTKFFDAYIRDIGGITEKSVADELAYYLQAGERGPREAFAEAAAIVLGGSSKSPAREALFVASFSRLLDLVRATISGIGP